MPSRATFLSSVLVVFLLLGLLEVGFRTSVSAAGLDSNPRLPDLNGDGVVDMRDVATCAHAFYSHTGDPNWNNTADLNDDGAVDMRDIAIIDKVFGKNCRGYDFNELSGWNVTSGDWSIQSGALEGSSSREALILADAPVWKDCTLTARVKVAADGETPEVALAFCVGDSNNFYYAGLGCWGHRVSVSRHVGDIWQELTFSGDKASVDRDNWHILVIKAFNGTITLYLDGSLELSVNDSTFVRGSVGIRIWNTHVTVDYMNVIGTVVTQGQPAHSVLYADGTKLRAPSGEEVVLIGTFYDYNALNSVLSLSFDDVQKMKSYGGNSLELVDLWFKHMMPQRGVIDQSWVSRLDKWVSWCEQAQTYCIINFANFEYRPWGSDAPVWLLEKYPTPWAGRDLWNQASLDFWDVDNPLQEDSRQAVLTGFRFLADRYKNNRYVIFGLFDEPFGGNNWVNVQNAEHLSITYARFVERIVDTIRSTGAEQLVFVNRPYVWFYTDHFEPVKREGIVWDDHGYVSADFTLSEWKAMLNRYVQIYGNTFEEPFIVGGYGVYPFSEYDSTLSDWRTLLENQVTFLKSLPVCGYLWFEYPWLEGQYYDYLYNYLTKEDSDYILHTVF